VEETSWHASEYHAAPLLKGLDVLFHHSAWRKMHFGTRTARCKDETLRELTLVILRRDHALSSAERKTAKPVGAVDQTHRGDASAAVHCAMEECSRRNELHCPELGALLRMSTI